MTESYSDCRDKQGVLVGLIDTIINSARVYRMLSSDLELDDSVLEALKDMRSDDDVMSLVLYNVDDQSEEKLEVIKEFSTKLGSKMHSIPQEFDRTIADNFWNLI